MFRKTLRRIIPSYAILPLCSTGIMMLMSYQLAKLIQLIFPFNSIDMTIAMDSWFSFEPIWVLMYFGSYFFWAYQYITVARENEELACKMAVADAVAKVICFIFFIALPTTNIRPEVDGSGASDFLMRVLYWIDTPTNLFPSIHCFVAWLGTHYIFQCKKLRFPWLTRILCLIGSIMVFLSTLYTKQHVIWDVFAGIAVAEIGCLVAHFTKLPQMFQKLNTWFQTTKLSRLL